MSPTETLEPVALTAIFIAGLAASLHCAGMCGLLTCGLGIAGQSSQVGAIGVYHASRLLGYGIAGAIAGTIGKLAGVTRVLPAATWLPILLVALLVILATGLDRRLAAVPGLGKAVHLIRSRTLSIPLLARAGVVGISTPLLPCGPLYAVLAIALASGSGVDGAKTMLVFGLGAIPAIWATQVTAAWMNHRFHARHFQIGKRVLSALAAVSLVWHYLPLQAGEGDDEGGGTCNCDFELPVSGDQK